MGTNNKFKLCAKCETKKPPEGGVDLRPGRWVCWACWNSRQQSRKAGAK